jgi:hypothetical protein
MSVCLSIKWLRSFIYSYIVLFEFWQTYYFENFINVRPPYTQILAPPLQTTTPSNFDQVLSHNKVCNKKPNMLSQKILNLNNNS